MWFSISEQFAVIGYSVIMGVFFGIIYDFVKITRVLQGISAYSGISHKIHGMKLPLIRHRFSDPKKKKNSARAIIILFLGDIIFSLLCAAAYSLFLFHAIRGQVRWYFIVATAVGFFLYYFTVSKIVIKLIEALFWVVKIVIIYLWEAFLLPFRLIYRIAVKIAKFFRCRIFRPLQDKAHYRCSARYTEKVKQNLKTEIVFNYDV